MKMHVSMVPPELPYAAYDRSFIACNGAARRGLGRKNAFPARSAVVSRK